jgi:DNA repair exonuclease SbcCD ATPase subunit
MMILLFTPGVAAQSPKTDVGIGPEVGDKKYFEVSSQLEQGLPALLENIKDTATYLKDKQITESLSTLRQAQTELTRGKSVLTKESQYEEIRVQIEKIESSLEKAEELIKDDKNQQALNQLAQAYRWTKSLSESPVLKLAATEIALNSASDQVRGGDYRSAGLFLQQAIDNLTKIQNDPNLNSGDLQKLKNDIIITQQQVVMGKLQDEKKLKGFYPGLAAARVNSLNTYYNIWSRSDMPWDLY